MLLQLTLAGLILVATIVGGVQIQRRLRGDSAGAPLAKGQRKEPTVAREELEALIASSRREKPQAPDTGGTARAAAMRSAAAAASAAPRRASAPSKLPNKFLNGPAKVVFLALRAALPDHHVFPYARLADAVRPVGQPLTPQGRAQFAQARVDFVVCNKELTVVAMLDITDGTRVDDPLKRQLEPQLSATGVRYLRLAPDALPKPTQIRALVLGN